MWRGWLDGWLVDSVDPPWVPLMWQLAIHVLSCVCTLVYVVAVTPEHIVQLIIIINLCTTIIIRVCTEKHHCHCQTLGSWRIVGRQAGKQAADRGYLFVVQGV